MQTEQNMLSKAKARTGDCACGAHHQINTTLVSVQQDWGQDLARLAKDARRVLVVYDTNTQAVAGAHVRAALSGNATDEVCFASGQLHADDHTIGRILLSVTDTTDLLVAVGSGTINDATRYVSHRVGTPYLVVATAPSMDGYASSVSPVLIDGMKITFEATYPLAVLSSPELLCTAPCAMIAAGLGDMLGKYIALLDWELSHLLTGERLCHTIYDLTQEATALCVQCAPHLAARDGAAVTQLTQGLVLSGLAMQMMGNSRPASGCEHHISHFLEMRQLLRGQGASLHGDKVGVATLYALEFAHRFFSKKRVCRPVDTTAWTQRMHVAYGPLADGFLTLNSLGLPAKHELDKRMDALSQNYDALKAQVDQLYAQKDFFASLLHCAGGPTTPEQVGCLPGDMKDAILCAFLLRPRFTLLRLAYDMGCLEEIANEMCI